MEVSLVGGIGFLGVNLAEYFSERGWRVKIISRKGSERKRPRIFKRLKELRTEIVMLDKISYKNLRNIASDAYIYLLGRISGSREKLFESHVYILKDVIEVSSEYGSKLVYLSAISVLGKIRGLKRGDVVAEEYAHLDPNVYIQENDFEKSKAEGERLLVRTGNKLNGRWTIIRPGAVLGGWAYHLEWKLLYLSSKLKLAPTGIYPIPLTPVRGLSRLIAETLEKKYDSLWINAVAENVGLEEISKSICEGVNAYKRCVKINVRPLLNMSRLLKIGQLKVFIDLISRGYLYRSRILKDFEWEGIRDSIDDFVKWIRSVGGVKG